MLDETENITCPGILCKDIILTHVYTYPKACDHVKNLTAKKFAGVLIVFSHVELYHLLVHWAWQNWH